MGLFTSPVTLSDGTNNHIFTYRSQITEKNSVVGDYIELAADPSAESQLVVKHDMSKAVYRHLLQRRVHINVNSAPYLVTVNFTITANKLVPTADLVKQAAILIDALAEANAVQYLRAGLV